MKWFKHNTDSHTNIKHREILLDFGLEAYALYWICLELIGQQGSNYRLNGSKSWKKALLAISGLECQKLEKILKRFGELNLICYKSLERGDLYIPKMKERADEYSVRISRYNPDNVVVDKNRIDKIRIEYIKIKGWDISNFTSDDYGRTAKAIKTLIIKAKGNDQFVVNSIKWASKQNWCDWTLETIVKQWNNFITPKKSIKSQPDYKAPHDEERFKFIPDTSGIKKQLESKL